MRATDAHFERLVAQHKDAVYRQMVRMCGNPDDAEDVLVESLLDAYRALHQLHDDAAFQGWLAIIARRTCGRLKRREALLPFFALTALTDHGGEPTASGPLPDQQVIDAETHACLATVIDALPPLYRTVYELRDVQELPASTVAERLGISVAAVKSRLHRARALVREGLDSALR